MSSFTQSRPNVQLSPRLLAPWGLGSQGGSVRSSWLLVSRWLRGKVVPTSRRCGSAWSVRATQAFGGISHHRAGPYGAETKWWNVLNRLAVVLAFCRDLE